MRRGWMLWVAAAAVVTLAAAKTPAPGVAPGAAKPAATRAAHGGAKGVAPRASRPDSSIGLSRTSVFSIPAPPAFAPSTSDPGEKPKFPRAYPGAPPRIPHAIADFLPITRAQNMCLDCHDQANASGSGAVAIPKSHYRDMRRAPDAERPTVAGARYVCVSCHVPQTEAPPLVGNRFAP